MPKRRWAFQWVWLLPVVAAIIGGWLAVRAILADGPTVTIRFKTAEGLEAGKTRIKYKDVDIGVVKSVTLAEDRAGVVVKADLSQAAPRISSSTTRASGSCARASRAAPSRASARCSPARTSAWTRASRPSRGATSSASRRRRSSRPDSPGKQFVLRADDIGSLDVGSPVYYRRLEAGRVIAYELDKEGSGVIVRIFVNAPYDRYVTPNARFWHASGIDVALDANGLKINTESLASGARRRPRVPGAGRRRRREAAVAENTAFTLFADRAQAMKQPITVTERYALVFRESVRGLAIGAPVDFRGLLGRRGESRSTPQFDREKQRVRDASSRSISIPSACSAARAQGRARPRTARRRSRGSSSAACARSCARANLLTGQLFVALDFVPRRDEGVARRRRSSRREIPTMPGSTQELQATISSIAKKLDSIPYQEIGVDLRRTLQISSRDARARSTARSCREARETMIEARKAMEEAREVARVGRAHAGATEPLPLKRATRCARSRRAAQSFRVLADYLERHPEAVIRGKKEDPQ